MHRHLDPMIVRIKFDFPIFVWYSDYLRGQGEVGSRGPLLAAHGTPARSPAGTASPSGSGGVDRGGALALPPLLRRTRRLWNVGRGALCMCCGLPNSKDGRTTLNREDARISEHHVDHVLLYTLLSSQKTNKIHTQRVLLTKWVVIFVMVLLNFMNFMTLH